MRRISNIATFVALAVGLAIAAPAFAGKGGNGHGGGGGGASAGSTSLTATATGGTVLVSGCGYAFAPVELDVTNNATGATSIYWAGMWATSTGNCFSTSFPAAAGSYTVKALQSGSLKATASFTS